MHLLILDDEERICTFFADVATGAGWTVQTAGRRSDFREQLFRRRPDAVILDLHLGETDGISEMRFLAQSQFCGPIGLMSGFDERVLTSAQQIGESLGLHVVDVILKPIRAATARGLLAQFEVSLARTNAATDSRDGRVDPPHMPVASLSHAALDAALSCSEMELYYHPIVSAQTLSVSRIEALIRWNHPSAGLIMPGAFIPLAEANQQIIDRLSDWVVSTAATQVRALGDAGLAVPIAVNISGANLHSIEYPERIEALLGSGVQPASLIFEVTESVAIRNSSAPDILTRLRLKGFGLSIDDFGMGYSSLEALRRIPFSSIKVDQTFVADLERSKDSIAIVNSVIALARSMNLESIAEGVETAEIATQLIDLGIDHLQGYHYSRPLASSRLVPWLREWSSRLPAVERRPS